MTSRSISYNPLTWAISGLVGFQKPVTDTKGKLKGYKLRYKDIEPKEGLTLEFKSFDSDPNCCESISCSVPQDVDMDDKFIMDIIEDKLTTSILQKIVNIAQTNEVSLTDNSSQQPMFETCDDSFFKELVLTDNIGVKLQAAINIAANEIGHKTRRGVGNIIVISPVMLSILQATASETSFVLSDQHSRIKSQNVIFKHVGTLSDKYDVLMSMYPNLLADDEILVAYTGTYHERPNNSEIIECYDGGMFCSTDNLIQAEVNDSGIDYNFHYHLEIDSTAKDFYRKVKIV